MSTDSERVSVYVRNISFRTEPDTIRKLFEQYGPVRDVYMPRDYHSKKRKGFGYVEFEDKKDAEKAIQELNDKEVDGMNIMLEFAKGDRKSSDQMRRKDK
jgi:FUS-interacting serine-arginine-rich protein 1